MKEISRIVINGWPSSNEKTLEGWLFRCITQLKAKGEKTKFLITPGGFALGDFPENWDEPCGWASSKDSLPLLIPHALPVVNRIVSKRVVEAARKTVKYLTLSVDLRSLNTDLHAELIAIFDINTESIINWTGKSYPTMNQENKLVHITDPSTHLFKLGKDRALILGCHDLNVFNGRALANQKPGGNRHRRSQAMLKEFIKFNPTHIIQHPHGTDTWRSWNQSWNKVARTFPNAHWASAITYASKSGPRRAPLKDVLARTHSEGNDSTNIIVRGNKNRTTLQNAYLPPIAARV